MLFPTSGSFLVHQVIDISPRPTSGMYRGIAGGPTGILSAALPRNVGGEGVKLARPHAPEDRASTKPPSRPASPQTRSGVSPGRNLRESAEIMIQARESSTRPQRMIGIGQDRIQY